MRDWAILERFCGQERLGPYVARCDGDHGRATELYHWNIQVSSAFWAMLAYFEVALRNRIADQLASRGARLGRAQHWIFDETCELGRGRVRGTRHRQPYKDLASARHRVSENNKSVTPGQVISETSFGLWHQMVSQRQMFLWPDLAAAFPHAPSRNQAAIREPIGRIRTFRNRLAHHHRIWSLDIDRRRNDVVAVASYMDPDLATLLTERCELPGAPSWLQT